MDDRNWLADELNKKHKKDRKWAYIGSVVGTCLIIGVLIFFLYSTKHNTTVRLDSSSPPPQSSGSVSIGSGNGATSSHSTPAQTTQGQYTTPTITEPSVNSTTPAPDVYTKPITTPQVDCTTVDSNNLSEFNSSTLGFLSELSQVENQEIPSAAILGASQVLSTINSEINTTNGYTQKNFYTYRSEDTQSNCAPSSSNDYHIPICTDLNLCISEIPTVP